LRVSSKSAAAAKIPTVLGIKFKVSGERAIVRLGVIRPQPSPRLASYDTTIAGAP